jgi:hypothetical protein
MQGFKNFGPGTLWKLDFLKAELSDDQINLLLDHSQQALEKDIDWSKNLVGEMKKGKEVKFDFPSEFDFKDLVSLYLKNSFDMPIEPNYLKVRESWVVSQYAGDYNPVHSHESTISGIIYLKVPEQIEKTFTQEEPSLDGTIQFIYGNYHRPSLQNFGPRVIMPKVGEMYVFPSYILHTVYPFIGGGERRSIAFNMDII